MTSPIWATSMLTTAERLAGKGAGRGRPAACDLRRATSSAYYALFHQITRHGVLAAVPSADEAEIASVSRWFAHGAIRQACDWVLLARGTRRVGKADLSAVQLLRKSNNQPPPPQLVLVAEAFRELQDVRHEADYSNSYNPVRYVTLDHIADADAAVRATWSMWRAQSSTRLDRLALHDSYRRFLQLALLRSGVRSR